MLSSHGGSGKHPRLVIIDEQLGIAAPRRCRTERASRVAMGQMVLKLDLKPQPMRTMIVALCEDAANVRCKGHKSEQMLLEESLSFIRAAMCEDTTRSGELQGSILELGKFQDVKCPSDRKEIVDFQGERARQARPLEGRRARLQSPSQNRRAGAFCRKAPVGRLTGNRSRGERPARSKDHMGETTCVLDVDQGRKALRPG